jgi:serine/threonine-protein kinase
MEKVLKTVVVTLLALLVEACTPADSSTPSPTSPSSPPSNTSSSTTNSLTRFDGTYDYAVTVRGATFRCSNCFYITNGRVSNSEGSFSGRVLDNFGTIVWNGPCPDASCLGSCGTFTGTVNWGSGPGFGQGQWDCGASRSQDRWSILNGTRGTPPSTPSPPPSASCKVTCWACTDDYGAIAYSRSTGKCAWAINYASRGAAENAATQRCGASDCGAVIWFRNACGALARGSRGQWASAWAGSRAEAERNALSRCNANGLDAPP